MSRRWRPDGLYRNAGAFALLRRRTAGLDFYVAPRSSARHPAILPSPARTFSVFRSGRFRAVGVPMFCIGNAGVFRNVDDALRKEAGRLGVGPFAPFASAQFAVRMALRTRRRVSLQHNRQPRAAPSFAQPHPQHVVPPAVLPARALREPLPSLPQTPWPRESGRSSPDDPVRIAIPRGATRPRDLRPIHALCGPGELAAPGEVVFPERL